LVALHGVVFRKVVYNTDGANCAVDDLSMNSKCYRKFHNSTQLTWWRASNDCLSRGGSLAVFTDIGRPSDNRQLTNWLNTSDTNKTYWIGLIRPWWKTTNEGEIEVLWAILVYLIRSECIQCIEREHCISIEAHIVITQKLTVMRFLSNSAHFSLVFTARC